MKVLLIDNGTKHLTKLKQLLGDNVDTFNYFDKYPSLFGYNLVVLSGGSKLAVKESPESFYREIEIIKTSHIPILGICEGCEIIAYAFSSDLEYVTPKVKGIKDIEMINSDIITLPSPIKVYEAHHWAIKRLGKKLSGLAKSASGYEIIKHKQKPIYGFQFHPEMLTEKLAGDEIFGLIVDKINERHK